MLISNKNKPVSDWFVPVYTDLRPIGANDANKEAFKENKNITPLKSVIRENIQNSLDAKDKNKDTVRVEIALESIDTEDFPGKKTFNEYVKKIGNTKRWKNETNINKLLTSIKKTLNKEKLPILRFSDYNTTGAEGALHYQPSNDNKWNLLTYTNNATGNSADSGSGGSFGVGKNASKICSDLSTVIYTTKTNESNKPFSLGNATLASFVEKNNYESDYVSDNFYTYALNEHNKPINDQLLNLDSNYKRIDHGNGTDVYIMGFNAIEEFKKNVKKYVLSEFLLSIFLNKLSVTIKFNGNSIEINHNNLYSILEKMDNNDADVASIKNYYIAISNGKKGKLLDKVINKFNLNPDDGVMYVSKKEFKKDKSTSRFLMARENGMTIHLKRYNSPSKISGVFIARGALNTELRNIENVTHTGWNTNDTNSKSLINGINDSIKEFIKESITNKQEKSVYDKLINDFITLPNGNDNNNDSDESEINNEITNVTFEEIGFNNPRGNGHKEKILKPNDGKNNGHGTNPGTPKGGHDGSKHNPSKNTKLSEISTKSSFLLQNDEKNMTYIFQNSEKVSKPIISVSVAGETDKELPGISKATLNGKSLEIKNLSSETLIYTDENISRNAISKIKLTVPDSDIALKINVLKEDKNQ